MYVNNSPALVGTVGRGGAELALTSVEMRLVCGRHGQGFRSSVVGSLRTYLQTSSHRISFRFRSMRVGNMFSFISRNLLRKIGLI